MAQMVQPIYRISFSVCIRAQGGEPGEACGLSISIQLGGLINLQNSVDAAADLRLHSLFVDFSLSQVVPMSNLDFYIIFYSMRR